MTGEWDMGDGVGVRLGWLGKRNGPSWERKFEGVRETVFLG